VSHLERLHAAPLVRRLPADLLTPVGALMRLRGSPDADAFLFESVERGERIGRYSYVGTSPVVRRSVDAETFRGAARAALGESPGRFDPEFVRGLPRFVGGLIFALDWEFGRALEPRLGAPRGPVAHLAFFRNIVAFDHLRQEVYLIHNPIPGERPEEGDAILGALASRLDAPLPGIGARRDGTRHAHTPYTNLDDEAFAAKVRRAKEYIAAGDAFQVVLSRRFEVGTDASGLSVYRALRMENPSPFMFYLRLGDREWAGASPELLVRVDGREVATRPIAGTRRRGASELEDLELEAELRTDPKERAEHAMLVDLARNDLGRICASGSVSITRHMEVERFSHVMHLVSEVEGTLSSPVDAVHALEACFPAGTVSGAPKVRAIEIISELEPDPRGLYAGAVGACSFSGALDACIAIRMVEVEDGVARFQAGAGIVADSVPEREAEETREKAQAMVRAITRAETELA